jgi:hypothetical protein
MEGVGWGGMGWGTLLIFFGKQNVIENITLFPDKKPFSPISSCSLHLGRNIRLAQGEIPSKFPHIFYWGEGDSLQSSQGVLPFKAFLDVYCSYMGGIAILSSVRSTKILKVLYTSMR